MLEKTTSALGRNVLRYVIIVFRIMAAVVVVVDFAKSRKVLKHRVANSRNLFLELMFYLLRIPFHPIPPIEQRG